MRARGPIVAPVGIPPAAFARALAGRVSLVLAPSSARGWFGGRAVVAWDPVEAGGPVEAGDPVAAGYAVSEPGTIEDAGGALEAVFTAAEPALAAALVTYEGAWALARFAGALVLMDDGWRSWGEVPADTAEVVAAASARVVVPEDSPLLRDPRFDLADHAYRHAVEKVRERIAAGDVYVLNLTARFEGELACEPADAFGALVARAGSEMSAWLRLAEDHTEVPGWIASVSPERFLRVRYAYDARLAEVCPIKGTRPRGANEEADRALAAELLADEKERAEHIMVVDLERNDLGHECEPGTVHVEPLYEVVPTPYCHQLVSTVRGTVRSDATFAELLRATFPCGSVTGAPKVAAVRIAAELERTPRGAYCGSLLVAVPGELDSSVLIRTLEDADAGSARWGTGCGITYESDAASEWLELLLKASPVLGDAAPTIALRETMRVVFGRVPLLARHLARLASGGAGPGSLARVRAQVAEQLANIDSSVPCARLGITVTPDGEVAAGVTYAPSSLAVDGGVRYSLVRVDDPPPLPSGAAKPAARRFWDRAHHAAERAGAHQAILVDPNGVVIDGSTANVWIVRDGEVLTPPAPPAVAGVMRGVVFDTAASLRIPARAETFSANDIETADEVFFSNAYGGLAAAEGRSGQVFAALRSATEDIFAGDPILPSR